jgi:hypothetical protein
MTRRCIRFFSADVPERAGHQKMMKHDPEPEHELQLERKGAGAEIDDGVIAPEKF